MILMELPLVNVYDFKKNIDAVCGYQSHMINLIAITALKSYCEFAISTNVNSIPNLRDFFKLSCIESVRNSLADIILDLNTKVVNGVFRIFFSNS